MLTLGAIHSTKISRNFGPKLNGSVRSNRKNLGKTGPPFEVDHFSRPDRLEFWLNGSRLFIDVDFIFDSECLSAGFGEKRLFSSANILQIADVVRRVVFLLFLLCF